MHWGETQNIKKKKIYRIGDGYRSYIYILDDRFVKRLAMYDALYRSARQLYKHTNASILKRSTDRLYVKVKAHKHNNLHAAAK